MTLYDLDTYRSRQQRRQGFRIGIGLALFLAVVLWAWLLCSGCIICAPATSHTFAAADPATVATNSPPKAVIPDSFWSQ